MGSLVSDRNGILNTISNTNEFDEEVFPGNIEFLSVEEVDSECCNLVLERAMENQTISSMIEVVNSNNYDGTYSIKGFSEDRKKIKIQKPFAGTDAGEINNTGHIYKDNITKIENFPAVLLEIDETEFTQSNASIVKQYTNMCILQVVDLVENHEDTPEMTKLEATQDLVWNEAMIILDNASNDYALDVESLEVFETVIDEDKKCSVAFARVGIVNSRG